MLAFRRLHLILDSLQEELHCNSMKIANEPQIYDVLEDILYEDGTNIRNIATTLEHLLRKTIYGARARNELPNIQNKRLILALNDLDQLVVNIATIVHGQEAHLLTLQVQGD